MASYALLIGIKNGKRELIEDGQPVEIRRKFKTVTEADGYESIAVLDKHQGQIRSKKFAVKTKTEPATKKAKNSK